MNKRQVVVLWIIAILLVAAAFLARSSHSKGFESKTSRTRGQTVISDLPAPEVAKVQIKSGDKVTTLVRKDGKWTVAEREDYPANVANLNELLRTLSEVKVTQGIESEPSFAPRFGMDPGAKDEKDRGTEVTLTNDAGSELAHVTLGKNLEAGGDPMSMLGGGSSGRFIRNHADQSGVYVVSELFSTLTPEPQRWLEDDFLKIEKIKSVSVTLPGKPNEIAWKLSRAEEDGEFTLEGAKEGESLDPNAATPVKTLFSYVRFEDVVTKDKAELVQPIAEQIAKIETFEGFTYTFKINPAPAEEKKEINEEEPPAEPSYLMTVDVEATLPAERKKEDKESEEDAKTKDKAFTDRKADLEKRLAADKALAGRTFKVSKYTVDALLKDRAALLPSATPPAGAGAQGGFPGGMPQGLPPGMIPPGAIPRGAMPPGAGQAAPPRRRVEAVTPPIAIPPLEESEEAKPQETPKAPEPEQAPKPEAEKTEGQ
jgi:hypothetical protein